MLGQESFLGKISPRGHLNDCKSECLVPFDDSQQKREFLFSSSVKYTVCIKRWKGWGLQIQ